jgi:hypothetical protein
MLQSPFRHEHTVAVLLCSMFPQHEKEMFFKFPVFRPLVLLIIVFIRNGVLKVGGMILTGQNGSTVIKARPNATLSTTKLAWTCLGSSKGLRGEMPATKHLRHLTALRRAINVSYL